RFSTNSEAFPALRLVMAQYLENDGDADHLLDVARLEVNYPTWVSERKEWVISIGIHENVEYSKEGNILKGAFEPWIHWVYRFCSPSKDPASQGVLESLGWDIRHPDEGVLRFEDIANDAGNALPSFS